MKALLLSPELFLHEGGIARIMRLYLKALCAVVGPGGRVDSLVLNDPAGYDQRLPRYSTEQLGEHVGCGRGKFRFVRETQRLSRRADVVVCGHLHLLPIAQLATILNPRLRYYLVAHGIEVWRPYTVLERRALLGAHRILCISEYTRRSMLRFLPELPANRLVVVPNTYDPYFAPALNDRMSQAPFATPRILTVSRLSSTDTYKGVDTLIEAMPLVRKQFPLARLRIVGKGDDQPRLEALVQRLGAGFAVDFLGPISDEALRAEYAACDLFALPSRKEGFGLVFLEAMTYGKPCVGARAGGTPEVITEETGQLAEYANIPDLAAAIADLVNHPRDSKVVHRHAETFAFPAFMHRLAEALS
jgi:glycosyltransferase involved in cell wall biosynthesis